jgi:citrate lyase gamma subunit
MKDSNEKEMAMQIQVNSDSSIVANDQLGQRVESTVSKVLKRFEERLTRVEVHLSDVNSEKGGARDKRCLMEARPTGHEPVAVTNQADNLDESVRGAAEKLKVLLDRRLGKAGGRGHA